MSIQRLFLDDIYESERCGGSVFRAVVMMAQEARFLNEQHRLKFIQLQMKPTTLAMKKFKDDKLEYTQTNSDNLVIKSASNQSELD
jgi:uncharacterized protein (UPF0305 family)